MSHILKVNRDKLRKTDEERERERDGKRKMEREKETNFDIMNFNGLTVQCHSNLNAFHISILSHNLQ